MRKALFSLALLSAPLLAARPAAATPEFPNTVQNELGLSYQPACALCHQDGRTGGGSVTTPFGRSAKARGIVADNDPILRAVLQQMKTEGVDSDADGVSDIDELVAGTDPNTPPNDTIGEQAYGCIGRVAPGNELPSPFALLALAAPALVFVSRIRARARRRHF
jgi:hypothetical protein